MAFTCHSSTRDIEANKWISEFEASLVYIVRPYLLKKKKTTNNKKNHLPGAQITPKSYWLVHGIEINIPSISKFMHQKVGGDELSCKQKLCSGGIHLDLNWVLCSTVCLFSR